MSSDKKTPGQTRDSAPDRNQTTDKGPDQNDRTKPAVILPPKDAPEPVTDPEKPADIKGNALDNEKTSDQESSSDHARNPNPRANENLPDEPVDGEAKTDGPGSEITDGEAG